MILLGAHIKLSSIDNSDVCALSIRGYTVWLLGGEFLESALMMFLLTVLFELGVLDCVGWFFIYFLFMSYCISPATISRMLFTTCHWSWLVISFRLVRIGEYSLASLESLLIK